MIGFAAYRGFRVANGSFLNVLQTSRYSLHEALSSGWHVLKDWPTSFEEFLGEMATSRRTRSPQAYGLMRDFGPLIAHLHLQNAEPWTTVDKSFRKYLGESWDGHAVPKPGRRIAQRQKGRPTSGSVQSPRSYAKGLRRLTLAEVERRVGRSRPKVAALFASEGLLVRRTADSWGAPHIIEAGDIDRIAPEGEPPLDLKGVAKHFAVNRKIAKRLLDEGVICAKLGPTVDKSKTYLIPRAEVDSIIADITRNFQPRPAKRTRSFSSILKGAKKLGLATNPIIDAMRNGELSPIASKGASLSGFVFDAAEVDALFGKLHDDLGHERGLPVHRAAKRLGIGTMSMLWLVKTGHLRTVDTASIRITVASVQEFNSQWVKLGTLANHYNTSTAFLNRVFKSEGVRPLASPDAERYAPTYFNRHDLKQVSISTALSREKNATKTRARLCNKLASRRSRHRDRS